VLIQKNLHATAESMPEAMGANNQALIIDSTVFQLESLTPLA
jgi:hypothetical protein